ncbi:unnamed protein product [Rhizoctonia solani]|uniref:Uncharacterized protein n=1 Tax=Rhizoctonia solani TaxID=456999 RepID=A0A8H3H472_9AGAM|nr:uncharacterized protein RhiXN_10892 [Rhizoctonia solani]QRW25815.1 hypothetical protein RhiXN_10892 [Rhizoctonia solani]CAE6481374.1 unnamed protein product [Rhizoctonia solani]
MVLSAVVVVRFFAQQLLEHGAIRSETFGAGNGRDSCCGGPRGCCHSCFSGGFDEDSWDKKDAADRNRAQAEASSSQPAPTPQMDPTTPPVNSSQAK